MVCPERWRLLAVYQRKVRVYTLAVSDVRVCHELEVGAEEYAKLRHETLSTFADCDAAFQALHRHHASHKCLGA